MHIEDDIAREGEDFAAERHHKQYQDSLDRKFDAVCAIINAVCAIISILAIGFYAAARYRCPGYSREVVQRQAAQLDAEGGAK